MFFSLVPEIGKIVSETIKMKEESFVIHNKPLYVYVNEVSLAKHLRMGVGHQGNQLRD